MSTTPGMRCPTSTVLASTGSPSMTEGEHTDGVQHRDDGDGEQRCVRAVAAGRLAVAPDPVARDGEQKGRLAETSRGSPCRPAVRPRSRPPRPRSRRAGVRRHEDVTSTRSGVAAAIDRRHDEDRTARRATKTIAVTLPGHRASPDEHDDDVEVGEVDHRASWIRLNRSVSVCDDARDRGDRDPAREERRQVARARSPAVTTTSPALTTLSLVTWSRTSEPPAPDSTIPVAFVRIVERGDGARLVGEERHERVRA